MEFVRGLFVQIQVIHALVLRETRSRFGNNQLGYLWAFIEPLLWIGTFAILFAVASRTVPNGMGTMAFLTTGIIPFLLFRQATQRSLAAISANKALLYYPQIRPLDLVLARCVLEIATLSSVFVVLMGFNGLFTNSFHIEDPLTVIFGITLAGLFGATLGLTLCSLSVYTSAVERMVGPITRPLMWISGMFFTANELPSHVRDIFIWNPVLHCTELVRDGVFTSYQAKYVSAPYVIYWILGLAFFGLTAERVARRRLEVT